MVVDDEALQGGDGRYVLDNPPPASGSQHPTPYFRKQVERSQWVDPDVQGLPPWTTTPATDNVRLSEHSDSAESHRPAALCLAPKT